MDAGHRGGPTVRPRRGRRRVRTAVGPGGDRGGGGGRWPARSVHRGGRGFGGEWESSPARGARSPLRSDRHPRPGGGARLRLPHLRPAVDHHLAPGVHRGDTDGDGTRTRCPQRGGRRGGPLVVPADPGPPRPARGLRHREGPPRSAACGAAGFLRRGCTPTGSRCGRGRPGGTSVPGGGGTGARGARRHRPGAGQCMGDIGGGRRSGGAAADSDGGQRPAALHVLEVGHPHAADLRRGQGGGGGGAAAHLRPAGRCAGAMGGRTRGRRLGCIPIGGLALRRPRTGVVGLLRKGPGEVRRGWVHSVHGLAGRTFPSGAADRHRRAGAGVERPRPRRVAPPAHGRADHRLVGDRPRRPQCGQSGSSGTGWIRPEARWPA